MEEGRKREILAVIEAWLDQWPREEPLPVEWDPESSAEEDAHGKGDLVSLTDALIALRRDVQIQGKASKRLLEALGPVTESLSSLAGKEGGGGAPRLVEGLMDLYHRLRRTWLEGREMKGNLSFLARLGGADSLFSGYLQGLRIVLDRLEEILAGEGVRPFLPERGAPFDPAAMEAVGVVPAGDGLEPGRVARVRRPGFRRGREVFRPAEVEVAR